MTYIPMRGFKLDIVMCLLGAYSSSQRRLNPWVSESNRQARAV